MLLRLFALFLAALPAPVLDAETVRAAETAFAIRAAVCDDDGDCDEARGALLAVTAAEESRGRAGVRGDSGRSCGRFQLGVVARAGRSCDELDADPFLDARTALAALRTLERTCGSLPRALGAYASGFCDRGVWHARHRCALSGAC